MKDMIFEADRKTARQGDSVELRWDADMPDSLSVIIDNGIEPRAMQVGDSGSSRIYIGDSRGKYTFTLKARRHGKDETKTITVKVTDASKSGKTKVAGVSGSLWFDGFVEWAHKTPFFGNPRLYLSLGVKEKNAPDRRMATVEDATRETAGLLEGKGFDVTFEMVPGTHFSPAAPKFDRALEILLQSGRENSAAEQ